MALAQEHAQAGEERGRWEKELAGSEVEAQVLQMDIDALTRRLQLTSASSAAMRQLRQKLSEEDRLARQGLAADAQHILNLPDVFFNGHVHAMKAEIQALMHRLSEAQELKAEQDIIQERLAASIKENEQLKAHIKAADESIDLTEHKLRGAEAELDCMNFERDDALAKKREQLDSLKEDLIGLGSAHSAREADLQSLQANERRMRLEVAEMQERCSQKFLSQHGQEGVSDNSADHIQRHQARRQPSGRGRKQMRFQY